MLQISQTENPMCSASIDQMRLRRATALPLDSQNFSSSGFQSEIQAGSFELIRIPLLNECAPPSSKSLSAGMGPFWGGPSGGSDAIAFDARSRSTQAIQASCQAGAREKLLQLKYVAEGAGT